MYEEQIESNQAFLAYIVMAIFPIMAVYAFLPSFSIGYFLLTIVIVLELIRNRFHSHINYEFLFLLLFFILFNLLIGVIKYTHITNSVNNAFGMIIYMLVGCFYLVPENYSLDDAYNVLKKFAAFYTYFLIFQFIMYYVFGAVIKGALPLLIPEETAYFFSMTYGRPTSLFTEPAHYCIFIAPIYALSCIKKDYYYFILLFIGLVLSTSSSGYFICAFVPLYSLFMTREQAITKVLVIFSGMLILIFLPTKAVVSTFGKFSYASLLKNPRIFGTLKYFRGFDTSDLLFGIGYNRLNEVLLARLISLTAEANYSNAYIFGYLSFGLIGGTVFLIYTIGLMFRVRKEYRVLGIILVFMCMSDQLMFNRNLLYLLWWIYIAIIRDTVDTT